MVKLKNIEKNDTQICCDIFPEDSETAGKLKVDFITKEIEYQLPENYQWCISHVHHAKRNLLDLISVKELPKEQIIMWY